VQYGAHNGVDVSGAQFPSNPYGAVTQPGPYHQQHQQQHQQQQLYPAILPAAQQQQQQSYFQSIDPGHTQQQQPQPQQQQQRAHPAAHRPTQQQFGLPSIASPASGPGAPPPDFNSLSPVQYGGLTNNVRQEVNDDDDDDDDGAQPDDNDPEPVFHLPPPPEGTYRTQEALEEAVHSWSLEHGYELVRRASKKNAKGVLYKRYMHCSKHGKAANTGKLTDQTRQRVNRKSSRMNCPMSIAVVAIDPLNTEGQWQVRHRKTHHNHGPLDALNLAGHRRRARAGGIEQAVDGLFAIGTPTAQVLQFLQRTNPHGLFTRTDVANMKLKYKKFGTCLVKADTATAHGRPCNECRARKIKCNNRRPTCAACRDAGKTCVYDHPPEEDVDNADGADDAGPEMGDDMEDGPNQTNVDEEPAVAVPGRRRPRGQLSAFQQNAQRAEAILATLQAFQTEHVTPTRLDFQSSAVEILAASSCGSGESYRNVPVLTSISDWPAYRDLMTEACMKENTFDVLIAAKSEPTQPPSDCKVEEWNEYVKKLAIFKRRNDALTAALWGTLSATFRSRVQKLRKAAEIWAVLEDACLPQGSQTGFKLYSDLHSITHANSADLKDYILRLENAYTAFNSLSTHWHAQHEVSTGSRPAPPSTSNSNGNNHSAFSTLHTPHPAAILAPAQDVFSEEMLCFLFLRNLAPEFQRWVDGLCATNNVAGFGTGPQLRFVELTRRAVEFESSVRARGAR
jgi:hypothetical protein